MRTEADISDVTVVIPVKNEELNLARCLERLGRFRHVVVIDSQSEDRTREIAINAGAKFLQFDWNGRYPKKRNWFLLNHTPETEWVLFLDADELINDAFCNELVRQTRSSQYDGFWLNYSIWFLGRRLRHGLPQRKLALLKVGKGLYEEVDEHDWSRLDMEVHEHPVLSGAVGEIATKIEHDDFRGIVKFLERHIEYAQWESERFLNLNSRASSHADALTSRQQFKYQNLDRWWYPWSYFLYTYFLRLGFLDRSAGFYYAFYKLWYFVAVRSIVKELRDRRT